ncbi:MAG: DHH family phosphoesterase [Candidatus Pacearchaeota archaeon]
MEKIKFLAGSKKRFKEFVNSISKEDNLAIISHIDVDGIASARVVSKALKECKMIKFIEYSEINNNLIKELKENKINKIIVTDLSIDDTNFIQEAKMFSTILVIDHHQFDYDFNSEKAVFINAQGYCAAFLCYYLFFNLKKKYGLDWLVACASIADFQYFKIKSWMKEVYKDYNEEFKINKIKKSKFWEVQWDLNLALIYFRKDIKKVFNEIGENFRELNRLKDYINDVKNEIEIKLKNFDKENKNYGKILLWKVHSKFYISSILATLVSIKHPNKIIIVLKEENGYCHASFRKQGKKINMKNLAEKFIDGFENSRAGGHIQAAGAHFLIKDLNKFKNRVKNFN